MPEGRQTFKKKERERLIREKRMAKLARKHNKRKAKRSEVIDEIVRI
jgi:hypothetical protein